MIAFPNCKINLGLHITGKRADGYHNLETVFYPIAIKDALEVIRSSIFDFYLTGLPVQGQPADNLCIKAYNLLKKDFPDLAPVHMHLHKVIPMGAGLGGGSADGAFTLRLLNDRFTLGLSQQQLIDYALQLGSDCPFFILNTPCHATGRGELMEPIALDLTGYSFMLINPGVHINTGWAFSQLSPAPAPISLTTLIQEPIETWKGNLVNDFEAPVLQHHPELAAIKEQLYNSGALYASMTGSGSTFYGIFPKNQLPVFEWPAAYRSFMIP